MICVENDNFEEAAEFSEKIENLNKELNKVDNEIRICDSKIENLFNEKLNLDQNYVRKCIILF